MLPLKLRIQGLYSYKTLQEIDFTELTNHHLFGIFGAVGSGKSSILDAITFALYGQIERVGKNDALNQNIFNKASSDFLVDFEFESGPNANKYRFVVRNGRRKTGDPKNFERSAYQWEFSDWKPLDVTDASSIFNLSYDNFRRTVIIPQGRFSDFLQLTGGERTKMMLELFPRLAEFELSSKVAQLQSETNNELQILTGQLQETGAVDSFDPDAKKAESDILETSLKEIKTKQSVLDADFRLLEELNLAHLDMQKKSLILNQLETRAPIIEARKSELDEFEKIYRLFHSELSLLDKIRLDLQKNRDEKVKSILRVKDFEILFAESKSRLNQAQTNAQQIPMWDDEIRGVQRFILRKGLESQFNTGRETLKQNENALEDVQHRKTEKQIQIQILKEKLESVSEFGNERSLLVEYSQFLKDTNRIKTGLNSKLKQLEENQSKMAELKLRKDQILQNPLVSGIEGIQKDPKVRELIALLDQVRTEKQKEVFGLREQLVELATKQQLFEFSTQMKDGDPCPLCGSEHHPSVLSAQDVGIMEKDTRQAILRVEAEISGFELQIKALEEIQTLGKRLIEESSQLNEDKAGIQEELDLVAEKQKKHAMTGESETSILQRIASIDQKQKEVVEWKGNLKSLELKQKELDEILNSDNQKILAQKQEISKLEGQIESLKQQNSNSPDDLQSWEFPDVRMQELSLLKENALIFLEKETARFQSVDKQWNEEKTRLNVLNEQVLIQEKEESERNRMLINTLNQESAGDEQNIRKILSKNLDTNRIRKEIDDYRKERTELNAQIQGLTEKINGRIFNENELAQVKLEKDQGAENISEAEGKLAVLKSEFATMIIQMERARKMTEQKNILENRSANLSVLSSLFRSNAFVNYASSVYLRNVVEIANQRFFKLTKQKLRLVLDSENTFYVKDYMNNGHERLAKTLSGGQIFQASLSLALALADTVRHLTQSDRNFFFLDEGFGSLDKESLLLVFDTLRQLRHENRIVGVISHVEEMQQEIDACLKIRMDEEVGSVIERSF